jgi:hypothetical protein
LTARQLDISFERHPCPLFLDDQDIGDPICLFDLCYQQLGLAHPTRSVPFVRRSLPNCPSLCPDLFVRCGNLPASSIVRFLPTYLTAIESWSVIEQSDIYRIVEETLMNSPRDVYRLDLHTSSIQTVDLPSAFAASLNDVIEMA